MRRNKDFLQSLHLSKNEFGPSLIKTAYRAASIVHTKNADNSTRLDHDCNRSSYGHNEISLEEQSVQFSSLPAEVLVEKYSGTQKRAESELAEMKKRLT